LGSVAHGEEQLYRDVARTLDLPARDRAAIGDRCREYAVAHHGESNIGAIAELLGAPERRAPAWTEPQ
jgi:hypothetical protein